MSRQSVRSWWQGKESRDSHERDDTNGGSHAVSASSTAQIKVYQAATLQEVLSKVKAELGPKALIVGTRNVPSEQNPAMMAVEVVAQVPAGAKQGLIYDGTETRKLEEVAEEEEIGGLVKQLQTIREVVVQPFLYPEMYERLGIDPPKGVLMYGPPGTGKTLIARTVARECSATFIPLNATELLASGIGESEKNLRDIFEKAKKKAPSLIFIDEIDAIAGSRDEAGTGTERRLVTQLLTLMDGLEPRGRVIILAATNRPDSLDPAIRRPGRFDREIEVPIPDKDARYEILRIHTRKMALGPDADLQAIAEKTHGYVGADLASLCKEAGMQALREAAPDGGPPPPGTAIFQRHFDQAIMEMRPSTMRSEYGVGAMEASMVGWDDVGDLEEIKRELNEAIVLPVKRPDVFERMGISSTSRSDDATSHVLD